VRNLIESTNKINLSPNILDTSFCRLPVAVEFAQQFPVMRMREAQYVIPEVVLRKKIKCVGVQFKARITLPCQCNSFCQVGECVGVMNIQGVFTRPCFEGNQQALRFGNCRQLSCLSDNRIETILLEQPGMKLGVFPANVPVVVVDNPKQGRW
jgi:hypothetical protein